MIRWSDLEDLPTIQTITNRCVLPASWYEPDYTDFSLPTWEELEAIKAAEFEAGEREYENSLDYEEY